MKKQFLIIAIAFTTAVLFSCKKNAGPIPPSADPLMQDLQAWFKFDGDYKDGASKVADASTSGAPMFTTDRNGVASHALRMDGASSIKIPGVTYKGINSTVCAWVKFELGAGYAEYILSPSGNAIAFRQADNKFQGVVSNPTTDNAASGNLTAGWHFFAVTYNGTNIDLFVDGTHASATNLPGNINDGLRDYVIGQNGANFWTGSIDEVRVYSRILSAADIQNLSKL